MSDDNITRLEDFSIELDTQVHAERRGHALVVVIKGERTYVEQALPYQRTGVLYLAETICTVAEESFKELCRKTYEFLNKEEGNTPIYLRMREAGMLLGKLIRGEKVHDVAAYKRIEKELSLPPFESLTDFQQVKDDLKRRCHQTKLGSTIRITGSRLFANFLSEKGEQLLPYVEPYITSEAELFKASLSKY